MSLAETMLAGGDFLSDLDQQRKDAAGLALRAVPEVPAATAVIGTWTIVRRVEVRRGELAGDTRSRRRRTIDPGHPILLEVGEVEVAYAYSFIMTNVSGDICKIEAWFEVRGPRRGDAEGWKRGGGALPLPVGEVRGSSGPTSPGRCAPPSLTTSCDGWRCSGPTTTGSWSQRPYAASCSRLPGGSPPVDAGTPCAGRPAGRVMAGLLRAPAVAPARHPNAFVQSGPPKPSRPQLEPPGRGTDALVERAPNQETLRRAPNHHAPTWYRRKAVPLSIASAVSLAARRASRRASAVLRSLDPRIGVTHTSL